MKPIIPFAALACALAAPPAAAQDAPRATSVSLGIGGGTSVGLWRDLSPRVRAGVEAGTDVSRLEGDDGGEDYTSFFVEPTLKIFSGADGDLRPYTLVGVYGQQYGQRYENVDPDAESEWRRRELGARVGLGLEWAPISRVAIGGHVGASAGYLESVNESTLSDDSKADGWAVRTFSSGLVAHLFF
ncbi:hypothetical protein [Longimicrobium sp.]|uniref:hypothetical protein n=1 Tax=Longimicrobium sp. TaxID=2029185 RepID=UPI002E323092|nr:hypothetical protein [Longimicrobium sp.]HEX6042574.1 hypothetical protein [Longimicrobium sp.]